MSDQQLDHADDRRAGDGSARLVPRRSVLRGLLGGAAAVVAANSVTPGVAHALGTNRPTGGGSDYEDGFNTLASEDSTRSIPFYGEHQAGIGTPPQTAAAFLAFDVTAANRAELTDLFRTLTARAAFLTAGGTPAQAQPNQPPADDRLLGPTVLPDDLTVTVALGASLFDGRYGLGPRKPAQLETMRAFPHDALDPAISDGDLLVQLCANHHDTVGHAMLDLLQHTGGGMRLRWRMEAFRFPPRPVGIPRDWMGFKDGITNPDTSDAGQMNQEVWLQPGTPEPAWTAGGTYQVIRIIRMLLDKWSQVPVDQQEHIFGRRKLSGAPLYATSPTASDTLDPVYTNDPQGLLTPLNCHIRLANPQTPQTAATSAILRRSFQYDRSLDPAGVPNLGHVFCCFQQQLNTYTTMQTRLEDEILVPYITPMGGGYFFAVPGVRNAQDYFASGLLA
ncbi:MAG: Tat-translocated enzyme [Blastococcus sp.]|jgi:deferrochelatase/peroxidase EfeB|nr:Tat-translocated enzyme [Blastococcus sp.]